MKLIKKQLVAGLALSATLVLTACGDSGGSSGDASGGQIVPNDFAFPAVTDVSAAQSIETSSGIAPGFSARRTLTKGSGAPIQFGEQVALKYNMYSWATGELVESTDSFDEPLTVQAGVTNGVPEYLTKSLLGRQVGDVIQVVFERGMEDLPAHFDAEDAYVLVVSIL